MLVDDLLRKMDDLPQSPPIISPNEFLCSEFLDSAVISNSHVSPLNRPGKLIGFRIFLLFK
jgi:hypothetical protein